jgi:DNA-binding GntR family transcriptional regulator
LYTSVENGVGYLSAYDSIKEAIIEGIYKPGERLTEENVASELNLSRTPIREALKRLENEGMITPLKRGVIVKQYTAEDIRQIYDLRALLEGYAAGQAAIYRNEEDIQLLREANIPFTRLDENYKQFDLNTTKRIMDTNRIFHDAVFSASKNDYIQFLISKVVVIPLVFRSIYWYDLERLKRSIATHETIITAIKNRDSERAKTAMLEHIYLGRDIVLSSIKTINREKTREDNETQPIV